MKKAVIVIPTYNESGNIEKLLSEIFTVTRDIANWTIEVLVVDSNSPDKTAEIVNRMKNEQPLLHLLQTEKEGLGKAYTKGFTYALTYLKPFVLFEMDADFSHDPKKIPEFIKVIEKGADFVVGSRYIKGGSIPKDWGLHRKLLSVIGNLVVRLGFMRLSITDWTGGYRAIKVWVVKEALTHIEKYSGYVFQIALLDYAFNKKITIKEVPFHFSDRQKGVSKIPTIQYFFQSLWYVFTHSGFIKFVIVGFVGFGIDFGFAYVFINAFHIAKTLSNVLSAEIAIIGNFYLNNFWSFKEKKISGGVFEYIKKFVLFNTVSSGSIVIQWLGLTILLKIFGDYIINIDMLNIQSWIIYKILIIAFIIIPYSYILYNKIIWKKQ